MNREVEESRGQARKLQADAADGAGPRQQLDLLVP